MTLPRTAPSLRRRTDSRSAELPSFPYVLSSRAPRTSAGSRIVQDAGETFPAWATGWNYFRLAVDTTYDRFFWSPDHRTWVIQRRSGETLELGVPLDGSGDPGAIDVETLVDGQHPSTANIYAFFRWKLSRQYDARPLSGATGTVTAPLVPANTIRYVWGYVNPTGPAGTAITYLTDIYDTPLPGSTPPLAPASYAHHVHLWWTDDSVFQGADRPLVFRERPNQLLSRVDVTSATFTSQTPRQLVRSYAMTYQARGTQQPTPFNRSLLSTVTMTGDCTGSAYWPVTENPTTGDLPATLGPLGCAELPPVTLAYTNPTPNLAWTSMGTAPANAAFIDVDGDGYPDAVTGTSSGPSVAHNVGGISFASPMSYALSPATISGGPSVSTLQSEFLTSAQTIPANWGVTTSEYVGGTDMLVQDTASKVK